MEPVRLNKYLAYTFGISRREADLKISEGRVVVNGKVAQLGNIIRPERDTVVLDAQMADQKPKRYTYLLLNKPIGYVCSRKQQGDIPTIYSLLPRHYHHLKVAGRLDKDSCGLLLLTDDGDTIFKLTHPKFGKAKKYSVGLNKPLDSATLAQLESGVELEDGTSNLLVSKLNGTKLPNLYSVTMHEGRNRQIRRTFKHLGYAVTHLERIAFGPYKLTDLGAQKFKQITSVEIN